MSESLSAISGLNLFPAYSRIFICGSPGSGKTTFARRLGHQRGLGVIELDRVVDWQSKPRPEEARAVIQREMAKHPGGWICEGGARLSADLVVPLADAVICFDLPLRISFLRLMRRTARRLWAQRNSRAKSPCVAVRAVRNNSALLWSGLLPRREQVKRTKHLLQSDELNLKVFDICSPSDVEDLLAGLCHPTAPARVEAAEGKAERECVNLTSCA